MITAEQLKDGGKSGIIQVAGQTVNTRMRAQKQQEHIWGSKKFIRRTEQAKAANTTPPSAFNSDVDVEKLVREHMGKGFAKRAKDGSISEYFSAGYEIGQAYLRGIQAYEPTSRACVKYSKDGWHAFPVKEQKKDD